MLLINKLTKYKTFSAYSTILESGIGIKEEIEKIFLIYYRYPNNDIITGENKNSFKRTNVILFKDTYCFFEIYSLFNNQINNNCLELNEYNIDTIIQKIKQYDGTIHVEVPETSYGRVKR